MSNLVQLEINGIPVSVPAGTTILNAAKAIHVKIPTLCYHPDLKAWAACGICVVRNAGSPKLLRACCTEVAPGMKITTHDADIVRVRRAVLELILANHPNDCLQCPRSGNCELQKLAADFGIRENPFPPDVQHIPVDNSTCSIVLNPEKCVKCGRCAIVCQEMQNVWALEFIGRGEKTRMAPAADVTLNESPCIKCGQCSAHCPVGAIYERDQTRQVWDALRDEDKYCVVQIAPAVRVAIGEAFGLPPGKLMTGETYAALRRLGFKAVFDTNYSADLTIMEEGSEFIKRFTTGGTLPLITFAARHGPTGWRSMPRTSWTTSTAKSPQQMLGVLAKTYYAEKDGCRSCKDLHGLDHALHSQEYEISRSDTMFASGYQTSTWCSPHASWPVCSRAPVSTSQSGAGRADSI